ncbi:unnamed protein product [Symbiodinium sp. KB8]|nr:unnamed protein product [Symbiodinium sp. KB8]
MSSPLVVVALEGCHGAGKSELLGQFAKRGYHVLDEGFLDMPEYAIHPQSLLSETCWVCSWFERLLKLKQTATAGGVPAVVFADRSPLSAVYYGHSGHLLEPVIRAHMVEVEQQADVHIVTAHVLVEQELLWERIQARLLREPHRARLQEGRKQWMQDTLTWYTDFEWDITVRNGKQDISTTADALLEAVANYKGMEADTLSPCPSPELEADGLVSPPEARARAPAHDAELSTLSESYLSSCPPSASSASGTLKRSASAGAGCMESASGSMGCGSTSGTPTPSRAGMESSPSSMRRGESSVSPTASAATYSPAASPSKPTSKLVSRGIALRPQAIATRPEFAQWQVAATTTA